MSLRLDGRAAQGGFRLEASLQVAAGEVVGVLGPNGAGKTTLLRVVAGLTPLASGTLTLDDARLDDPSAGVWVGPEQRRVGMVFQDHRLFPHMSALDNVAFPLRARGAPRHDAHRHAREWLQRLGMAELAGRRAGQLSGGEAQRVALARALAMGPRVMALDEPLAALDAEARGEVRRLLAEHLRRLEQPVLFVTHDPVEAATLTDRLLVLEGGRVTQTGTVQEVTRQPKSLWVARLVGLNLYRGRGDGERLWVGEVPVAVSPPIRGPAWATVRPQGVALHRSQPTGSPRNTWPGRVRRLEAAQGRVRVEVEAALPLVAEVTPAAVADLGLVEGMEVWVAFKATEVEVYPE